MNQRVSIFLNKVNCYFDTNCFTNIYGISRSLLALGTFITLTFDSEEVLFDKVLFNTNNSYGGIDTLNIFFLFGYDNLQYSCLISKLILLLVMSGYFPRFSGILHWIVAFSFQNAASLTDGGDQIAMVLSFYFIPLTILDSRMNHFSVANIQNSFSNTMSVVITKIIIPLQISIIYFHSAIEKLYKVEEWRNGTALFYILDDPLFGLSVFKQAILNTLYNPFVLVTLSWGTIFLEILLSISLVIPYGRKKIILWLGLSFHFFIAFFLGLVSFFCSMACGLLLLSLDPSKQINFIRFKNNTLKK